MTIGKRSLALVTLCGLVLVAFAAGTRPAGTDGQQPFVDRILVQTSEDFPGASPVEVIGTVVASADATTTFTAATAKAEPAPAKAPEATPAENDPIVVAALPPSNVAPTSVAAPVETEAEIVPAPKGETPDLVQLPDECVVLEVCVDHYLFELYQRSAKLDTSKVVERRKVKVKRKGKVVTVTRSFTKLVNEDFTWKDPHAAEKAGMSMMDYVIGGMDRGFKLKLFQALRAAEKEGHAPGITSGFRDDYRQSIATGLKAASNRSYHGGSLRGGYGHGMAADVVSTKGATRAQRWVTTEVLWKWIDANEQQFGVGRPYLDRDPPHVTPIDGEEYVSRRGTKVQVAGAGAAKPARVAVKHVHVGAKAKQKPGARKSRPVLSAKQKAAPGRP